MQPRIGLWSFEDLTNSTERGPQPENGDAPALSHSAPTAEPTRFPVRSRRSTPVQSYSQLEPPKPQPYSVHPATAAALASLSPLDDIPDAPDARELHDLRDLHDRNEDPDPIPTSSVSRPPPLPVRVDAFPNTDPASPPPFEYESTQRDELEHTPDSEPLPSEDPAEAQHLEPQRLEVPQQPALPQHLAMPQPALPQPVLPQFEAIPAPAQQPVAEPAPSRQTRAAWSGWLAAALLLALGVMFYALGHVPLQRELDNVRQSSAKLLDQQSAIVTKLRAELEREREQTQREQSAAAAASPVDPPSIARRPAPEQRSHGLPTTRPSATDETPRQQASSERSLRKAEHEAKPTTRGVDRAAAAAATAALEAETYGRPTPATTAPAPTTEAPKKPSAPEARDTKDSLSSVVNSNDDPLQGL